MKNSVKKSLFVLLCLVLACIAITFPVGCEKKQPETSCEIKLTDTDGNTLCGVTATIKEYDVTATDLNGSITFCNIPVLHTDLNKNSEWFGVTVVFKKDGYLPLVIFNFVLYDKKQRQATVTMFKNDGSLPYCAYVEIPSKEEIRRIIS